MKKLLSASAAVAALFVAAPAFAGSGHVDLSYSELDADFIDIKSVNIGGAAVTGVGGDWNVQGDVVVHRVDVDFGPFTTTNYTDAGLHLFNRNDSWAAGVYADSTDVLMMSAWGLGVEGEKYFDRVTLNGSIGWNTAEGGFFFGGDDVDGWNATAGATFFATDNLSIGADVKHMDLSDDLDATVWGLSAEFKPDTMPVSFFAGYRAQDGNIFDDDSSYWRLGLRWNFGGGSLKERDRTGASMNGGMGFADVLF